MGLFDPAEPTTAADPIVDGEDLLAVQIGCALPPTGPYGRDRVLPRGLEPRNDRPSRAPAEPPPTDPLQDLTPWLPSGHASYLVRLAGEANSCRSGVIVKRITDSAPSCPWLAAVSPSGVERMDRVLTSGGRSRVGQR